MLSDGAAIAATERLAQSEDLASRCDSDAASTDNTMPTEASDMDVRRTSRNLQPTTTFDPRPVTLV